MTRVDFYFNAADKLVAARMLAAKIHQAGQRALLYVPDERDAAQLDAAIWSADKLAFVPHVRCGHPLAVQTPILIGTDADTLMRPDVLVNLSSDRPPFFSRFERLIELVSRDPADREAARERYRFYQQRGYAISNVDLAART